MRSSSPVDPLIWTFVVSAMSGVCLSEFSMSFAATMWNIWLECNNIIFNNIASNFISRFFRTKELVMLCIGMTTLEGEDYRNDDVRGGRSLPSLDLCMWTCTGDKIFILCWCWCDYDGGESDPDFRDQVSVIVCCGLRSELYFNFLSTPAICYVVYLTISCFVNSD